MNGAGGLLDRYVLRRMAATYGLCLLTFVLLFLVIDGFSRLDEFIRSADALAQEGRSVWTVASQFYATKTPRIVSTVGPYLTLFAGIATILSLARTNELVPMLTAGRSAHRVLLPVYLFAALAAGGLLVLEESVVPGAIRANERLDKTIKDQGKVEHKSLPHLSDGRNRLAAGRWLPSAESLMDVVCQRYEDPSGRTPSGTLRVRALHYRKHPHTGEVGWYPSDGVVSPSAPGPDGRALPDVRLREDVPLAIGLTPARIDAEASSGDEGLDRAHLEELIRLRPHEAQWAVRLHTRTTRPVASLVLFLLGIPFVVSPEKRSIPWGLGVALALCIAFFATDFLFQELALRAALNPAVLVWTPPVLFAAAALALMDRVVT